MKIILGISCRAHLLSVCLSLARKISSNNFKNTIMNAMNNFTISGFVVKDAEVKNFEKSSIARFGLSFKTSEKNGNTEVVKSAIVNIETWIKNDDAATQELLKKGSLIKIEGFFKADPYTKDGKSVNQYRLVATKIEQVQKKAQ